MPRFFLDTYDGDLLIPDEQGQELEDIEAAKRAAQETLPDMAKGDLPDGNQRVFLVSVRDEAGQVVVRIALSLVVDYPSHPED